MLVRLTKVELIERVLTETRITAIECEISHTSRHFAGLIVLETLPDQIDLEARLIYQYSMIVASSTASNIYGLHAYLSQVTMSAKRKFQASRTLSDLSGISRQTYFRISCQNPPSEVLARTNL